MEAPCKRCFGDKMIPDESDIDRKSMVCPDCKGTGCEDPGEKIDAAEYQIGDR